MFRKGRNKRLEIISFVSQFVMVKEYTDLCYGFGVFRRGAHEKLLPLLESRGFEIEGKFCIKAKKPGLEVVEVLGIKHQRCARSC